MFALMNAATKTGGRSGARRLVVAALAFAVLGAPCTTASAGPAADPQVKVEESGGIYTVAARFTVAQPASVVLAVLTDYERIPRFMPDVRTSIVRERSAGRVVVEQAAVAKFMAFSRKIHLLLEIQESSDTLRFRDASGRSFTRYEGRWHVSADGAVTHVTYELTAKPSFSVPQFLLTRALRRDAKRMVACLRAEIGARATSPDAAGLHRASVGSHRPGVASPDGTQ